MSAFSFLNMSSRQFFPLTYIILVYQRLIVNMYSLFSSDARIHNSNYDKGCSSISWSHFSPPETPPPPSVIRCDHLPIPPLQWSWDTWMTIRSKNSALSNKVGHCHHIWGAYMLIFEQLNMHFNPNILKFCMFENMRPYNRTLQVRWFWGPNTIKFSMLESFMP